MNESMEEILLAVSALEEGIVPLSFMHAADPFKGMSEEEQRAAKRKFRKIKRKLAHTSHKTGKKLVNNVSIYQIKQYLLDRLSQSP
jgi:hypothetical protein